MFLQLEILAIGAVVLLLFLKTFLPTLPVGSGLRVFFGRARTILMEHTGPWVRKNITFLVDLVPAAVGAFVVFWYWSQIKSGADMDIKFFCTIAALILGAAAFGIALGFIAFTRGLMSKWQGW